ncbi:MAG: hypothetical protein HC794_06700 [Nitrospiraceae bacterium]|nr:hypothetical protein [Nitrospiraceae bacterium]
MPAPFPKVLGEGWLGRTAVNANLALIKLSKTLFSYQIFVLAETTPELEVTLIYPEEREISCQTTP